MKKNQRIVGLFVLLVILTFSRADAQNGGTIALGNRRELFVDNYLIDKLEGLSFTLHSPRDEGPVFYFDKPWEGPFCGYATILRVGDVYRAYYRGLPQALSDDSDVQVTCIAESKDGIHWEKPVLGLYPVNGDSQNNVVLKGDPAVNHNFSPFLDTNPHTPAARKYKAIGGGLKSGLFAYTSPDGLHWEKSQNTPVFTKGIFDSQNVAFWSESEKKYVLYFRSWSEGEFKGKRSVSRATSSDFIHWENPRAMTFGNTPLEEIYTHQTSPYFRAPHIYLAIGARFMPGRKVVSEEQAKLLNVNPSYYKDCSDAILMSTRGGTNYDRTFMESFIRPGIGLKNWVSRSNYPALNVVQTGPDEMSVYVNQDYAQPTANLHRYSVRLDGFSSLSAKYAAGSAVTKYFTFTGSKLFINYATSAPGEIRIEILDDKGNPVPGYTLADSATMIGNETERAVSWNGKDDVSALAGKKVCLRLTMKDADLYSFWFK